MHASEDSRQLEQSRAPESASSSSPTQEVPFGSSSEAREETNESGVYSAEEEALVEERLKNLGYL